MNCFICDQPMNPFFSKIFNCGNLKSVDYWKCGTCGFVASKTHHEMTQEELKELNYWYHSAYLGKDENKDDPRWLERLTAQANTIDLLTKIKILSLNLPWVDYGCGDGKLVDYLKNYNLKALKFDRYMGNSEEYISSDDLLKTKYDLVINTSVFEHVTKINPLDEIAGLVAASGAMALHVLVRETIPSDPDWFYLLPVHTAFYTNKSMQILFERWNFKSSLYHVPSRMWFFFKVEPDKIMEVLAKQLSGEDWHYKKGFMDFWKL